MVCGMFRELEGEEFLDTVSCCQKEHRLISAHVRDDEERVFGAVAEVAEAGKIFDIPVEFPISAVWPDLDKWSSC